MRDSGNYGKQGCNIILRLFIIGCMLMLAYGACAAERPNIVVFIADDLSQLDTSPYGARDLHTPNMERLASSGLTFNNAFVASPTCAPSRAALLTGLMPAHNGAEPNHSRPRPEIKKWPAYFHDLGYEVVAFGKVSHYEQTGDYGFDFFAHDTFHDDAGVAAAAEFLRNRSSSTTRPLCLMVGTNWPHVPWPKDSRGYDPAALKLPAGSFDTSQTRAWRAQFATAVTNADNDLGLIRDGARTAFGKNMIFVFSTDNGTQWPFGKWDCYDAGIRVPLIVEWPDAVKPATRTDAMVSWVDFLPTLVEAVGGTAPSDIDGRSFLGVLRGTTTEHRDRIFSTHSGDGRWNVYPIRSLRTSGWKYILNLHPEFAHTSHIDLTENNLDRAFWSSWEKAARTNATAAAIISRYHARPGEELYDVTADPGEQHNLATDPQQAARLAKMRAEMQEWMKAQGDHKTVFGIPRLLSDPASYRSGSGLEPPTAASAQWRNPDHD